jgi:hypothetical protein
VAGKLRGRCVGAVPTADGPPGRLFYLVDSLSGIRFLVDSGAAFSVLPHQSGEAASGPALRGADGSRIACWGRRTTAAMFGGRRFQWNFLLAAVAFPIIGSDFMSHFNLVLDFAGGVLSSSNGKWS